MHVCRKMTNIGPSKNLPLASSTRLDLDKVAEDGCQAIHLVRLSAVGRRQASIIAIAPSHR